MKAISLASEKGGQGKTTVASALGTYLAYRKHKRVLFIDLNRQADLSSDFNFNLNPEQKKEFSKSNIFRAFNHDSKNPRKPFPSDFKPYKINKFVSIFSASQQLRLVDKMMAQKATYAPFVLLHVFGELGLKHQFDYVIMDLHNDFQDVSKNAFVLSDYILSPVNPNWYGIKAISPMVNAINTLRKNVISPVSRQSFITAKLYFVGNMIKSNTRASHDFSKVIGAKKNFIAGLPERELFNKATNAHMDILHLAKQEAKNGNRNDLKALENKIEPQLERIYTIINK